MAHDYGDPIANAIADTWPKRALEALVRELMVKNERAMSWEPRHAVFTDEEVQRAIKRALGER